jgi:hypothetical protein
MNPSLTPLELLSDAAMSATPDELYRIAGEISI